MQSYTSTLPGAFMTRSSVNFTFPFYCYSTVNIANNDDDDDDDDNNNNNNNSVKFSSFLLMGCQITWLRTERTLMLTIKMIRTII